MSINSLITNINSWLINNVPKRDHAIVFRHQLSWYLVPILLIIWAIFPETHQAFTIPMIIIFIVGIIETIFFMPVSAISKTISVVLHILIVLPLIRAYYTNGFWQQESKFRNRKGCLKGDIKVYTKCNKRRVHFSTDNNREYWRQDFRYLVTFNMWTLSLMIAGVLLLIFLPYWPYFMSRTHIIVLAIIITIALWGYAEYL